MSKASTISDVALRAGVSRITVSKALNNQGRISPETRARVLQAATDLGYVANTAARRLRGGRTNLLGVLVQDLGDQYFAEILRGVNDLVRERGLDLVLYTSSNDPGRERERIAALSTGVSDGLIVISPHGSPGLIEQLRLARVPIVLINAWGLDGVSSVNPDNFFGARAATEHLIGLGHKRIGLIVARPDGSLEPGPYSLMRQDGYCAALAAAGLPFDPRLVRSGGLGQPTGRAAGMELLSLPERPSAIFAGNDLSAFGVIEAARDCGLRVPDDLSVVGFDDIPMAGQVRPALTTVHQPLVELGRTAAHLLLELLAGATECTTLELPSTLIVRDSTAPPRAVMARADSRPRA